MNLFRNILLFAAVLLITSCTTDSTLEDEHRVDDSLPMVFGTSLSTAEADATRSAASLEANFKVNTWKNFGNAQQQTVMDGFKVEYDPTGNPYKWDYVDVDGQLQRYWDLGAFPYEFRAVSPYFTGATITASGLSLDVSHQPFQAQTYINETHNITDAACEPCVVAHVTRQKDGTDYADHDIIRNAEINADAKANAVREVHMPFHHLMTKVGFRIFIDDPQPTSPDYQVFLKNMTISIENTGNNFVIASNTYNATNAQGLGKGTFSDNTTATGSYTLMQHGNYEGMNLRQNLHRESAYDLTPGELHQIPQHNVKIRVNFTLETDHDGVEENEFTYDRLLSLWELDEGDNFTWEPDKRYIYYLHIPNIHMHEIFLVTCEVLPWDDVQTTDIPVEM